MYLLFMLLNIFSLQGERRIWHSLSITGNEPLATGANNLESPKDGDDC